MSEQEYLTEEEKLEARKALFVAHLSANGVASERHYKITPKMRTFLDKLSTKYFPTTR